MLQMNAKQTRAKPSPELIKVTPEMAMKWVENNKHNRPLDQKWVRKIADDLANDRFKVQGDSIKLDWNGNVLDGQHRLWAVIESGVPMWTVVIEGLDPEVFDVIDTNRKLRTFGDTVAVAGGVRYRNQIGQSLAWLLRWQKGTFLSYKEPKNKIRNEDVKIAFRENPDIIYAVERAAKLFRICNPSLLAFFYYIVNNRNPEVAEQMMATLENPSRVPLSDPIFMWRAYMIQKKLEHKDPIHTIALGIKAVNALKSGKPPRLLMWRNSGKSKEDFPKLEI